MADPVQCRERLLSMAADACRKVFGDHGLMMTKPSAEVDLGAGSHFGLIGFGGKALSGSLLIGSSSEPLDRSNPARGVPLADWIAELANQTLGRLKNHLRLFGIDMSVNTPVSLRDVHVLEARTRNLPSAALVGGSGVVRLWLDVMFAQSFEMAAWPDPSRAGPQESEVFLF